MNEPHPTFSLIEEPWILAHRADGSLAELSLKQVFTEAHELRGIVGELPTQTFALTRLLLAIVYRATVPGKDDWARWWEAGRLPAEEVIAYLDRWAGRFDLLHPAFPFYQVADLHTKKGEFTELERLIGDAPVGHPFLTTRLGSELESLSFAEAARWLVHAQAFDVSGIKSGAVGDPRVKGGKGYPIGMGSCGHLGGVLAQGDTLAQTLLLNLIPEDADEWTALPLEDDCTAWEHAEAYGPAPIHTEDANLPPYRPRGVCEVLTWQSRRIRLDHDGARVRAVLICNGDRFSPLNLHDIEYMTAWRNSPTQAKKIGRKIAYMPAGHNPERALWRGLGTLLAEYEPDADRLPSGTTRWLAEAVDDGIVAETFVSRTRAFGIEYINNASVVGEVVDDEIAVPVRALRKDRRDLRTTIKAAVEHADQGVRAFVQLAINLDKAAGGDGNVGDKARAEGFEELDGLFRTWIVKIAPPAVTALDADAAWNTAARSALRRLARDTLHRAGPAAITGREVDGKHLDAALAESWFLRSLFTIFRRTEEQESR